MHKEQKLVTITLNFNNHTPIEQVPEAKKLLGLGYKLITIYTADQLYAVFGANIICERQDSGELISWKYENIEL